MKFKKIKIQELKEIVGDFTQTGADQSIECFEDWFSFVWLVVYLFDESRDCYGLVELGVFDFYGSGHEGPCSGVVFQEFRQCVDSEVREDYRIRGAYAFYVLDVHIQGEVIRLR